MGDIEFRRALGVGGATGLVGDLALNGGHVVVGLLHWVSSTIDLWFPLASIVSSTVAPRVEFIPEGVADKAFLAVALIFVLVLLGRIYRRSK